MIYEVADNANHVIITQQEDTTHLLVSSQINSSVSLLPEPCSESFGSTLFVCFEGLQPTYVYIKPLIKKRIGSRRHFLSENSCVMQWKTVCLSEEECVGLTAGTIDHGTLGPAGGCLESLGENLLAMLVCHLGTLERTNNSFSLSDFLLLYTESVITPDTLNCRDILPKQMALPSSFVSLIGGFLSCFESFLMKSVCQSSSAWQSSWNRLKS